MKNFVHAVTVDQLKEMMQQDEELCVIDTRSAGEFTDGFIKGAVFVGLEGNFVEWMLSLFSLDTPIVLVADKDREEECIRLLADASFRNIKGFLEGGFQAWKNSGGAIDMIINVDAAEMAMDIPFDDHLTILDVRRPVEYAEGHIEKAVNLPLIDIKDPGNLVELDEHDNLYIHCARGYRSVIAASLLKQQGYDNLRNVSGGWEFIKHTKGFKIVKETSALN
ncbi:MAG: rhodanese-like domain-containing protein [Agriterribacter sp.]